MMNNNFRKNIFYKCAGRIAKLMIDFQKTGDVRAKRLIDEKWDSLFTGKEFFEFQLNDDVKINLYKDSVLSRLIFEGFEKEETDYVVSVLNDGDIFVDVGANIGLYSLIASKIVGDTGKVICFEPSPTTFDRLEQNIKLNCLTNIDLRNIGLSDTIQEMTFYVSNNGHDAWNSFAPSQDNKLESSITVQVSTLETELEALDISRIKLIKIDVEGWEKFVLLGGKDIFVNYSPIVMVEFTEENTFNAGYAVHDIFDIMKDYGYVWYSLVNGQLIKETKKLYYPYNNLIAIKYSYKKTK